MHLQDIVRQTHQCPLGSYFVYSPEQKLSKPAALFYLSENRLNNRLPRRIDCTTWFSLKFAPHFVDESRTVWQRTRFTWFNRFSMLLSAGGYKGINSFVIHVLDVLLIGHSIEGAQGESRRGGRETGGIRSGIGTGGALPGRNLRFPCFLGGNAPPVLIPAASHKN